MTDFGWLAQEAKTIHDLFNSVFFALVTVFLLFGIFAEYFKWPLGQTPSFLPLVGRALIAAILLYTFTDCTNLIADFTDGIAKRLGDLNSFKLVLDRMGDKLGELSWSWVSVKDTVILIISFITFFVLYFSVLVADAFQLYAWTLLYVFSPVLIALFVLPITSMATKALYRSLIEVSCWKLVWSVLATLMWSAALSDINKLHNVTFLSAICFNLILAGSLLLTPVVVHALAGNGLSGLMTAIDEIAVGAVVVGPTQVVAQGAEMAKHSYGFGKNSLSHLNNGYQRAQKRFLSSPKSGPPKKPENVFSLNPPDKPK